MGDLPQFTPEGHQRHGMFCEDTLAKRLVVGVLGYQISAAIGPGDGNESLARRLLTRQKSLIFRGHLVIQRAAAGWAQDVAQSSGKAHQPLGWIHLRHGCNPRGQGRKNPGDHDNSIHSTVIVSALTNWRYLPAKYLKQREQLHDCR